MAKANMAKFFSAFKNKIKKSLNINNTKKIKKSISQQREKIYLLAGISTFVITLRLTGLLQPLEWLALDLYFHFRPTEPVDKRIIIVGIEESDIKNLEHYPLKDATLAKLLNKINQQQPVAIGLDIYRDISVDPEEENGHNELKRVFENTPNLIGIEKINGNRINPPIAPSPILADLGQVGANDVLEDGDRIVRRGFLYPDTERSDRPSLGLLLAYLYLQQKGISLSSSPDGWLQLKDTLFLPVEPNDGGYVRTDTGGYQIFINWRNRPNSFESVSVTDVLEGNINPNLMKDRIVIIGPFAPSLNDIFYTPYNRKLFTNPDRIYGVELQANLTSQIISSVIDGRPLIKTWPEPLEIIWIISWTGVAIILTWLTVIKSSNFKSYILALGKNFIVIFAVVGITYLFFIISAWWLPVVPPILGILGSFIIVPVVVYVKKLGDTNAYLENQVKKRTRQLEWKNQKLVSINSELNLREQQLTKAKEIAEEANAAKEQFLMNISHELRNPLNLILGYAKIIQRERNLKPNSASGLKMIQNSGNHLLTLINDILDFSKTQANKVELNNHVVDLPKFLSEISEMVKMQAQEKGINFKYKLANNLTCGIIADEQRLRQVLLNLLGNAVKFTDFGFVSLKVSAIDRIERENSNPRKTIRFEIIDTGHGISDTDLQTIFKPFGQVSDPNYRAAGTGLGLSISQKFIELMGGKISVKSQLNKGSNFWFDITVDVVKLVQKGKNSTQEYLSQVTAYKGIRREILVVEDCRENRELLSSILKPLGFKVTEAENGQQGLRMAQSIKPDMILTDLLMSHKTGLTMVFELRRIPEFQEIPIIGCSASIHSFMEDRCLKTGCNAFLPKPIDEQKLLVLLQKYLGLEWIY